MSGDALVFFRYLKSGYRIFTETSQLKRKHSQIILLPQREIGASWEARQLSGIHLWKDLALKRGCT